MDKVRVIERSLRCRRIGYWCLVPLLGVIAFGWVIVYWWKIRAEVGNEWNPATGPLRWALVLALIGSLITLATITLIVLAVLHSGPFG